MACHHLTKFGDPRYCRSRDIFLVCHLIKQDRLIKKWWWDEGKGGGEVAVTIGAPQVKFGAHRHCSSGDIMGLVRHVI